MEGLSEIFSNRLSYGTNGESKELSGKLYKKIGELEMENDWLKKIEPGFFCVFMCSRNLVSVVGLEEMPP